MANLLNSRRVHDRRRPFAISVPNREPGCQVRTPIEPVGTTSLDASDTPVPAPLPPGEMLAHTFLSVGVRLRVGAPGPESRSTAKYPRRANWTRRIPSGEAGLSGSAPRTRRHRYTAPMAEPRSDRSRNDRIVKMYVKGRKTGPQIADRLGLRRDRVYRVLRARGVKARPNGWNLIGKPLARNEARNRAIVGMYQRLGLTAVEISERLAQKGTVLSADGVLYVLRTRGIERKRNGWYPKPTPEFARRVRDYAWRITPLVGTGPGMSAAALAIRGGFKPATLRVHLRALGVRMRSGLGGAVLSFDDVRRIKASLVNTKRTHADLARAHGVGNTTIWSIAKGHTWTDVPWPPGRTYEPRRPARPRPRRR